jgi:hypothetical protein
MIQGQDPISSKDFKKGLVTRADILTNDVDQSPNTMDVKWNFDGSMQKRLGCSTTNSIQIGSGPVAGWTIDSGGTLTASLQSYWKLDESSGTRTDQYGTNDLSDINSVSSISGIRNQAALFVATASNGLMKSTVSSLETGNVNFYMSTWVYLNSTSTTMPQTLISKKDPSLDSATVLLLHLNSNFTDSSPSAKTVSTAGNVITDTSQKVFGVSSAKFDGSGDYLEIANSTDWDFSSGDFTLECWIRPNLTGNQQSIIIRNEANWEWLLELSAGNRIRWASFSGGATNWDFDGTTAIGTGQWYHLVGQRKGNLQQLFVNGTKEGSDGTWTGTMADGNAPVTIGGRGASVSFNGWVDEVRISKGVARYAANFTTAATAFGPENYEYWLYINTDNVATFRVSNNGSSESATVRATSIGALTTATWYNIVAWHSNNAQVGISVNRNVTTASYTSGVRVGSAPFLLGMVSGSVTGAGNSYLDARLDETGFWKKIPTTQEISDLYSNGSGNTYSRGSSGFGWGMFDFGASSIRWLVVAAGTGLNASSNRGTTFVSIATSRTQNYQYFERSKNVLIATSDSYDVPLYWAGSTGTFAATLAPGSAPSVKYSVNYSGFLILLNSSTRSRGFFYADENNQLTDPWTSGFDIPSSADDEITASFVLNKFLYISTRYRLFRVQYVGGNPDWSYLKVKDWGFVPRTVKLMTLKGGQVAVGFDWTRRLRIFDGYDDLFISDNIENDNGICDFAMSKISLAGSGLVISHAEVDLLQQEYRLNVAIGTQSTQTTHSIVLNGRTLAFYPYSNQPFQAMTMAESNGQLALMAIDRSGFVYILNSGSLDVSTPIREVYDSPILFNRNPQVVSKSRQINFYFSPGSCGTVYFRDRVDYSNTYSITQPLKDAKGNAELKGSESALQLVRTVDIPSVQNAYQFQLFSSGGTASPWKLTRFDYYQTGLGFGRGVNG